MSKIDLKKVHKEFYNPSAKQVTSVDVPPLKFLMIDGQGDPNTSAVFQEAVEALFSLAYTLKFMLKKSPQPIDYVVMPLEGLWWSEDMEDFIVANKANWQWTLMIMQPDFINEELFAEAVQAVLKKKPVSSINKVRLDEYHEGPSAQILYIGPYADEGPTIQSIHNYIIDNGSKLRGKHHEIYLSDFRKTAPEKLKTVIRQPMQNSKDIS